eukprot:TRINITY_DN2822_c0_g1_i5.p1 TRINITY_DN2822_c0_g1~~TRINITY_DN2822_c0_g1_i5.p1  ORF type:complete len:597 (+),score=106.95 TRINITY_DN2822_c0_g1_i5:64-1854(+)
MVFSGLVQEIGEAIYDNTTFKLRVIVPSNNNFWFECRSGDSISVNGVCLTLLQDPRNGWGDFFVMEETRKFTNLGLIGENKFEVNLEKSLKFGDPIGGHKVTGHVSGIAYLNAINFKEDGSCDVWIKLPSIPNESGKITWIPVVHKGSICLDGVSLTVAELKDDNSLCRVSLIPYTFQHTCFHNRKVGDPINVEYDIDYISTLNASENNTRPPLIKLTSEKPQFTSSLHQFFMSKAISLAENGLYTAPPNPHVGCVLVNNGVIIGQGYHEKPGNPHAEIMAINDAMKNGYEHLIKGCTVYVSLEPCHHYGRTPPCDNELVKRGVATVVVALADPDSRVSEQGISFLKSHGITVEVGICADQAGKSLAKYLHHRITGLPYCIVKVALSMDAKIACADGSSQWITGEAAREDVHMIRAASQAILIGSGTALSDKPSLTVRGRAKLVLKERSQPLRVVLDSKGTVVDGPLLNTSTAPTLIFHTNVVPQSVLNLWKEKGVEAICCTNENGKVDLLSVMKELGKRGILQVLVEGGAVLHSELLRLNIVDSIVIYQGSILIGSGGKEWLKSDITKTIRDARRWKLNNVQTLENDVCITYVKK